MPSTKKTPVKKTPAKKAPVKTTVTEAKPVSVAKEFRYIHKNINVSPRKLRLLARTLCHRHPTTALTELKFTNTKAARVLVPALKNIIATAKHNYQLVENSLKIVAVQVNEGLKIKRMDKSHSSRFNRGIIQKRHSRLTLKVSGMTSN